jgi:hypothetical protein
VSELPDDHGYRDPHTADARPPLMAGSNVMRSRAGTAASSVAKWCRGTGPIIVQWSPRPSVYQWKITLASRG